MESFHAPLVPSTFIRTAPTRPTCTARPALELEALGIVPEAQGPGAGQPAARPPPGPRRRDALPCYLTTGRRENPRFYRRLGFEVEQDALPLVPGGPTSWGRKRVEVHFSPAHHTSSD